MGKEDDNLFMFLSGEKRQDLESCFDEKPQQVNREVKRAMMEEEQGEDVVSSYPVFWICIGAILLVLSFVSGAVQFCDHRKVLRTSQDIGFLHVYEVPLRKVGDDDFVVFLDEPRFSDPVSPRDEYQGEAIVHDGRAYLTAQHSADERGVVAKPHSVGRLLHSQVFQMKHRGSKSGKDTVVSFRATFVFSIENSLAGREATGDGFAFVMVPEGNVMGSAGGSLGVMDLDKGEAHHTFAVEFDTWQNPSLHDISNNHVGINVNSMVSVVAEEAGYWSSKGNGLDAHDFQPLDLTSGKIQAWIDYDGVSQELTVRISPILGKKPNKPLLKSSLDLSKVLNEYMSVGFSAATGDFAAKHIIHSWQFEGSSAPSHWRISNNVQNEQVSVVPADSEVSRKSRFFQSGGVPRDHVSNLPVFRNPHRHREADMSRSAVGTTTVLPASEELVEFKPLNRMKKMCAGYLASFKEHTVLNLLGILLGFALGLLIIHLLSIAYHIMVGCYDTYFGLNDEPLGMVYSRVLDQSEGTDEARYVLVVSDGQHQQQQSENRPLDRV